MTIKVCLNILFEMIGSHLLYIFLKVHSPPIPCGHPCDGQLCDPNTDENDVQEIQFTIRDLHLEPSSQNDFEEGGNTLRQAYFLAVKALTGLVALYLLAIPLLLCQEDEQIIS